MDELTCPDCGKTSQPIDDENTGITCGYCGHRHYGEEFKRRIEQTQKTVIWEQDEDEVADTLRDPSACSEK